MWHNLSTKHDAQLVIIECVLDSSLHKERVEGRVRNLHGIPELTWTDVENRQKEYLLWEEERLILDTADDAESNLKKALEYINL